MSQQQARAGHDSVTGGHGSITPRYAEAPACWAGEYDSITAGHDSFNGGRDSFNGGHDSIIGGHDSNTAGARIQRSVPLVQVSFSFLVPFSLLPPSLPCAAPPSPSLCLSLRLSYFFSLSFSLALSLCHSRFLSDVSALYVCLIRTQVLQYGPKIRGHSHAPPMWQGGILLYMSALCVCFVCPPYMSGCLLRISATPDVGKAVCFRVRVT